MQEYYLLVGVVKDTIPITDLVCVNLRREFFELNRLIVTENYDYDDTVFIFDCKSSFSDDFHNIKFFVLEYYSRKMYCMTNKQLSLLDNIKINENIYSLSRDLIFLLKYFDLPLEFILKSIEIMGFSRVTYSTDESNTEIVYKGYNCGLFSFLNSSIKQGCSIKSLCNENEAIKLLSKYLLFKSNILSWYDVVNKYWNVKVLGKL